MNRVFNKQHDGMPADAIAIGRGSLWNSPFRIGFDGDLATVIALHARWLADNPHLLRALDELRGRDLVCDCAPLPCHGDVLLRLAAMSHQERLVWAQGLTGAEE